MKDIDRFLKTAELIEKSRALREEHRTLQKTLFDNAQLLVELAKKASDSAARPPKSYAPSKLGVPLPLPHVPTTMQLPKETVVIMRIRPAPLAAASSSTPSRRRST
jgi:hypothetical protein